MDALLPLVREGSYLEYPWFPTRAQCFIYRNWGIVTPQRMAEVLESTVETVLSMADAMGLDLEETVLPQWHTRGYITLIRNNWHLLDYDQLCVLLGWTREYLSYILKEDDFLYVKLGDNKPDCPHLQIEALDEEGEKRTQAICALTKEIYKNSNQVTVQPFDFFAKTAFEDATPQNTDNDIRYLYSYCALYGDTFFDRALIDVSFPDEMLKAYQNLGVTGVWTQAVLSKIAPHPFEPSLSEGYEKRMEGINYLIEKLARYHLKLYLYINEPRTLPKSLIAEHPDIWGHQFDNGEVALCMQVPKVQQYLKESIAYVVRNAKGLGGFFTITASENPTNCLYASVASPDFQTNCPRCKDKTAAETYALVNRLIKEAVDSVDPSVRVIAYAWSWKEVSNDVLEHLPKGISVARVSEEACGKNIGGVDVSVLDYSISIEGPSNITKEFLKNVKEHNMEAIAKLQLNNTWELATVPYIPAFEKYYRHVRRYLEEGFVSGFMYTWTLGGYPSPVFEMIRTMCQRKDTIPSLTEIYERIFAGADIDKVSKVLHIFSEAFDKYPFHITSAYLGPQHAGPSNLMFAQSTGWTATMTCYPYDDLEGWRSVFPAEVYIEQLRKMAEEWKVGLDLLKTMDLSSNKYLPELYDTAEGCYLNFQSMYNQSLYVHKLRDAGNYGDLLKQETELAYSLMNLMARNATIGYEAANHYFYAKSNVMEKIVNCAYLKENLK